MPGMGWTQSLRYSAAVIYQGDFAMLPAIPMSPHAHMLGSLTAEPAQPLPTDLADLCSAAGDGGIVFVSTGSSAIPGELLQPLA